MPVLKEKTSTSARIFDATIHYAIQASEIEVQMRRAAARALKRLQSQLIADLQDLPTHNAPQFADAIASLFAVRMLQLSDEVIQGYEEFAAAAGRALPRFLSRALRPRNVSEGIGIRTEQFVTPLLAFDETDVEGDDEEDFNDDDLLPFLFDFNLIAIANIVSSAAWQGMTIRRQWQQFTAMQTIRLQQRLNAAFAAEAASIDNIVDLPPVLRRAAAQELQKSVAGGRGVQIRQHATKTDVDGMVRTQMNLVTNEVIKSTIATSRAPIVAGAGSPGGVGAGAAVVAASPLITGAIWSAILDDRTCVRCAFLDGKFFPRDGDRIKGPPLPLHARCRCTWIPAVRKPPRRTEQRGRGLAIVTFEEWFAGQSEAFQRRMLGPGRFKLWKSGELTFRDFVEFRRKVPVRERTLDSIRRLANGRS